MDGDDDDDDVDDDDDDDDGDDDDDDDEVTLQYVQSLINGSIMQSKQHMIGDFSSRTFQSSHDE